MPKIKRPLKPGMNAPPPLTNAAPSATAGQRPKEWANCTPAEEVDDILFMDFFLNGVDLVRSRRGVRSQGRRGWVLREPERTAPPGALAEAPHHVPARLLRERFRAVPGAVRWRGLGDLSGRRPTRMPTRRGRGSRSTVTASSSATRDSRTSSRPGRPSRCAGSFPSWASPRRSSGLR